MDHTEGSVGGNFYEGEMLANVDYDKHLSIPSINFRPERCGYGAMVYMDVLNNNFSYDDDELSKFKYKCQILEGQWKGNKLHGFGRIIDEIGNVFIG